MPEIRPQRRATLNRHSCTRSSASFASHEIRYAVRSRPSRLARTKESNAASVRLIYKATSSAATQKVASRGFSVPKVRIYVVRGQRTVSPCSRSRGRGEPQQRARFVDRRGPAARVLGHLPGLGDQLAVGARHGAVRQVEVVLEPCP